MQTESTHATFNAVKMAQTVSAAEQTPHSYIDLTRDPSRALMDYDDRLGPSLHTLLCKFYIST